jgi:hypothetical protein
MNRSLLCNLKIGYIFISVLHLSDVRLIQVYNHRIYIIFNKWDFSLVNYGAN